MIWKFAEDGLIDMIKTNGAISCAFCDPAGTRTQGPYIKSVLLYQLSYGIISLKKGGKDQDF